jgi:hypothetical protein
MHKSIEAACLVLRGMPPEVVVRRLERDERSRDSVFRASLREYRVLSDGSMYRVSDDKPTAKPSLKGLERFADWFGIPTSKALKGLAGDYSAEIERLWGEGRTHAARWNMALAWGYSLWYVARSPFDSLVRYVMKSFRGGG